MTWVNPWADERLSDRLGEIIDAGLSSGQAALMLGKTRSACIARARRLGWQFGVARTEEQKRKPYKYPRQRVRFARVPKPAPPPEERMHSFSASFDYETVQEIRRVADRRNVSRAEAIRMLVEWGLEIEGEAA